MEGERVIVGSEAIVKHICDKPEGINLTPAAHKARIDKLVSHVNAVDIRKLVYGHFIATNAGAIQRAFGTVITGTRPSLNMFVLLRACQTQNGPFGGLWVGSKIELEPTRSHSTLNLTLQLSAAVAKSRLHHNLHRVVKKLTALKVGWTHSLSPQCCCSCGCPHA